MLVCANANYNGHSVLIISVAEEGNMNRVASFSELNPSKNADILNFSVEVYIELENNYLVE